MKQNEMLKRCQVTIPHLSWVLEVDVMGAPMALADLGEGRRVVCIYRDFGSGCRQVEAKVIDTGRSGPTFTHSSRGVSTSLSDCVRYVLKDMMDHMRSKLPIEEARLVSLKACIEAMKGGEDER